VTARYTYGDSELAGDRLELVATLFEPTSTSFLRRVPVEPPRLALDLGCGPGATTVMVERATGAAQTVGLDRSPAFIRRSRDATGLGFAVADVVGADLPCRPATRSTRVCSSHTCTTPRWCWPGRERPWPFGGG